MNCLVTGAAGFIGSHLCERLLQLGHHVTGIDAFIPYYPKPIKEANLQPALAHPQFRFHSLDMRSDPLGDLVRESDAVLHLGAMAGLAKSWTEFDLYASCNITATHRLLEAARGAKKLQRFLYISTSSVYGRFGSGDESLQTRPISPYGVTKLAGENLCRACAEEQGLPLIVLRYFSVYGPRQRPDMGYWRFIDAMLKGKTISVFGDGHQVRGNTYVSDGVEATVAALTAPVGETYNVGGGEAASVWDILRKLEKIIGKAPEVKHEAARAGDQRFTLADTTRLTRHTGWQPRIALDDGLAQQVAWHRAALESAKGL